MTDIVMTNHARRRLQQRAIPPVIVDLLFQCGSAKRSSGTDRLMFDKAGLRRLRRHLGGNDGLKHYERWLGVYAVVGDDGEIVTAARKTRRFRR